MKPKLKLRHILQARSLISHSFFFLSLRKWWLLIGLFYFEECIQIHCQWNFGYHCDVKFISVFNSTQVSYRYFTFCHQNCNVFFSQSSHKRFSDFIQEFWISIRIGFLLIPKHRWKIVIEIRIFLTITQSSWPITMSWRS